MQQVIQLGTRCLSGSVCRQAIETLSIERFPGACRVTAAVDQPCGLRCDRTRLRGPALAMQRRSAGVFATAASGGSADSPPAYVAQISVHELQEILADDDVRETVQLVDVREPWEAAESSLPHFMLLPLSRQQEWVPLIAKQLDPQKHTVVLCHHGMRSNMVANLLVSPSLGFQNVSNVIGGIDAYSAGVDSNIPRY